jgi:hypothetical protein
MSIDLKARNNEFWESVRTLYLEDFLAAVYQSRWKSRMLRRWLRDGPRRAIVRQTDVESDPLTIELSREGFDLRVGGAEDGCRLLATHLCLVGFSFSLSWFLLHWAGGQIRLPDFSARLRDHLLFALVFFG